MPGTTTILFAGGGTGGHLFPSIAIAQRLIEVAHGAVEPHLLCSDRVIDRQILQKTELAFTACPMRPLPSRPWDAVRFLVNLRRSRLLVRRMIAERRVGLVVAMGGFVSVPAALEAGRAKLPVMLVNLDAVPGKANRWLAKRCGDVRSVYASDDLPAGTRAVPLPLRRSCTSGGDARLDRLTLGLDPDRPVLLVTGASQGAQSINRAMVKLVQNPAIRRSLAVGGLGGWQVLHLCGEGLADSVSEGYAAAGIAAKVLPFCDQMGAAWGAADVAISRAGANSVAEVAVNAVPTIFLPYPYHKDQHQKRNAEPLVAAGGAVMLEDAIEPGASAARLAEPLRELLDQPAKRATMRQALRATVGGDGAVMLADQCLQKIGVRPVGVA